MHPSASGNLFVDCFFVDWGATFCHEPHLTVSKPTRPPGT
jgi:hypothetical protein